ncbi:MAG: hypothetical protein M1827_003945 [Pycnora praestabilis]|nr:MAG: hypothetical protein M1827_003945 [Pycnora praestabilis]
MSNTRSETNGNPLEKDFSRGHNGAFSPNYPSGNNHEGGDNYQNGGMNPNYPGTNGGHGSGYHLGPDEPSDTALKKIKTAGSISISPELFEKLYLSPQNNIKGDLRRTFGNPTPLAILGFLLSLTPLSCDLMGWRGAGGNGAASTGVYYFMGGLLMLLGGLLEFFLGNTFPFVVFCSFGGFWFTFGATLTPTFNSYGAYSPDPSMPAEGLNSPAFAASFGFFLLFMGLLCFIYLICSLRTNACFFIIFLTLVLTFCLLAGTYWNLALGNAALAAKLQVAAGACSFVTTMSGWWIFFAQMLAALDFPFQVPVGDMSHLIKGYSEKMKDNEEYGA